MGPVIEKHTIRLERKLVGCSWANAVRITLTVELRKAEACAPYLTIDLEPVGTADDRTYTELSICASIEERARNNRWCDAAFGQCRDEVLKHFSKRPGVAELVAIWDRWHLKGLNAGTRAQNEAIADVGGPDWYGSALARLVKRGIDEDRGYRFGSAWLVEQIPADVLDELRALCAKLGG